MELFIISAAIAFFLYQAAAHARLPAPSDRPDFKLGRFVITVDAASSRAWARRIVRGLLVFLLLLCILLVHNLLFPTSIIARNEVNIVLGFVFGPMFGMWVNSILLSDPATLTKGQVAGAIALMFLFIVGSVGKETGSLIERFGSNLNSVKFAGAELSFAERARRDLPTGVVSLGGPSGTTSETTNGLDYVGHMDEWYLYRDAEFMKVLFRGADVTSITKILSDDQKFTSDKIVPPFQCLSEWLRMTSDANAVNVHVTAFARIFRQFKAIEVDALREQAARDFVKQSIAVARDIVEFRLPPSTQKSCEKLVAQFCGSNAEPKEKALECIWSASPSEKSDTSSETIDRFVNEFKSGLDRFDRLNAPRDRPYFAIAYASMMAQLGQYHAVAAVLDDWIETAMERKRDGRANPYDEMFEFRARLILANLVEEWIRKEADKTPVTVRNEHLANLRILRAMMRPHLVKESFFSTLFETSERARDPLALSWPGGCALKQADARWWRDYFELYVWVELTYLQNTIRHPDYDTRFAETTTVQLRQLAALDVSCVLQRPNTPNEAESLKPDSDAPAAAVNYFAQILSTYGLNAIKYTETRGSSEASEQKKRRLEDAVRATRVGLEAAQYYLDDVKTRKLASRENAARPTFLERVATSEADATSAILKQNQKTLQDALNAQ
jgi:hypothetical protein